MNSYPGCSSGIPLTEPSRRLLAFIVCAVAGCLGLVPAQADTPEPDMLLASPPDSMLQPLTAPESQRLDALADAPQWRHLLHYRYHPFSFRWMAQNDSPDFYLAHPDGHLEGEEGLRKELKADVQAFLQRGLGPDISAQCRFPARYHWLQQQLPEYDWQDQPCPAFEDWRATLDAYSLTLVFPAAHINSPSSMYGHTLIRMDRKDPASSKLLAYSVNFAANANPDDNELVFSYKGLTGGYPGVVSVMPYHVKTREYQHMEYRNVWEYPLALTPTEVDQFVRHVWELKDTGFDYFFFDENCSYRVLAMIDAATERSDLADDFVLTAIPVETIRALDSADLIAGHVFRPSAAAELENMEYQSSPAQVQLALQLVAGQLSPAQLPNNLDDQQQAQVLELAFTYARYLSVKKKQASPALRRQTLAILKARSQLNQTSGSAFPLPVQAPTRDDLGHGSTRVGVAMGAVDDKRFTDLSLRPAYHDVMDRAKGFVPGSEIQMLHLTLRHQPDTSARVQQLSAVKVLSLASRGELLKPLSWGVDAGYDRLPDLDGRAGAGHGYLNTVFGYTWGLGQSPLSPNGMGRIYTLLETRLMAGQQLGDAGWNLSAGPVAGWLYQGALWQWQLSGQWTPGIAGEQLDLQQWQGQLGRTILDSGQLRLKASTHRVEHEWVEQWSLGLNWYF
ncbi:DUF4105 domain-containing protein [Oceanobacter sp. 4_MG-2023]|uniref:Lnb N-terminal periplasmic domain-containing protein n=1 Tax=Oceanobacter sp. 4_MG-2023 TaxID=3062623 RepID=UPI0027364261|nr:DUF4105 domain-containing protein [Oceanobacter sp. 4_MG-2023]MDP2548694.1 DUF4105 domain-containing protein [Oceanobacter sp. 4_MG-2023]